MQEVFMFSFNLKHDGKMLYFSPEMDLAWDFGLILFMLNYFATSLILFGFLCQQVSVESLNLRQVTHFYIQLQREGCVK